MRPLDVSSLTLPAVEVTACQYGGTYPDCKDPIPSGTSVGPTSVAPPAGPTSSGGGSGSGGYVPTSGDAFKAGPGAWVGCVAAGVAFIGGGVITYASLQQYYDPLRDYNSANVAFSYDPTYENQQWVERSTHVLNEQAMMLAGAAGVSIGGLIGIVAACSPSVALPTP
jgi:hypothetical protein